MKKNKNFVKRLFCKKKNKEKEEELKDFLLNSRPIDDEECYKEKEENNTN